MRNFTVFYIILFLSIVYTSNAQIVISTPSLGFTQACASPSFNTYNITFSFSPDSALSSTNKFIIELSDSSGDFNNATDIYTSPQGSITTSPATLTFSLPTSIAGESYRIKIKSRYSKKRSLVKNIKEGTLKGIEQICFFDEKQIYEVIGNKWNILDIELLTKEKLHENTKSIHAEYHVVLEKPY